MYLRRYEALDFNFNGDKTEVTSVLNESSGGVVINPMSHFPASSENTKWDIGSGHPQVQRLMKRE